LGPDEQKRQNIVNTHSMAQEETCVPYCPTSMGPCVEWRLSSPVQHTADRWSRRHEQQTEEQCSYNHDKTTNNKQPKFNTSRVPNNLNK